MYEVTVDGTFIMRYDRYDQVYNFVRELRDYEPKIRIKVERYYGSVACR